MWKFDQNQSPSLAKFGTMYIANGFAKIWLAFQPRMELLFDVSYKTIYMCTNVGAYIVRLEHDVRLIYKLYVSESVRTHALSVLSNCLSILEILIFEDNTLISLFNFQLFKNAFQLKITPYIPTTPSSLVTSVEKSQKKKSFIFFFSFSIQNGQQNVTRWENI